MSIKEPLKTVCEICHNPHNTSVYKCCKCKRMVCEWNCMNTAGAGDICKECWDKLSDRDKLDILED